MPISPSTSLAGTRRFSKRSTAWPPAKQLSSESIMRSRMKPGRSVSVRNMVALPSSMRAMMMQKLAPSAPVMNHFCPLMT
ncbi:hypothetical protein D3C72_1871870 [compost metagenome]